MNPFWRRALIEGGAWLSVGIGLGAGAQWAICRMYTMPLAFFAWLALAVLWVVFLPSWLILQFVRLMTERDWRVSSWASMTVVPLLAGCLWLARDHFRLIQIPGWPRTHQVLDELQERREDWNAYASAALEHHEATGEKGFDSHDSSQALEAWRTDLGYGYRIYGPDTVHFLMGRCEVPLKGREAGLCYSLDPPPGAVVEDASLAADKMRGGRVYEHLVDEWFYYVGKY